MKEIRMQFWMEKELKDKVQKYSKYNYLNFSLLKIIVLKEFLNYE